MIPPLTAVRRSVFQLDVSQVTSKENNSGYKNKNI